MKNATREGAAILLNPAGGAGTLSARRWSEINAHYEFVLTLSRGDYDIAASNGAQPILPSLRFSETDNRGRWRAYLGGLLRVWRWRRYLLNDGVERVALPAGEGRLSLALASLLAGARREKADPRA